MCVLLCYYRQHSPDAYTCLVGEPSELGRAVVVKQAKCPFWNKGLGTWRSTFESTEVETAITNNMKIHFQTDVPSELYTHLPAYA